MAMAEVVKAEADDDEDGGSLPLQGQNDPPSLSVPFSSSGPSNDS